LSRAKQAPKLAAMSYVDKALAANEQLVARAKLHWIYWLRAWLWLLLLGWILIGIYFFVRDLIYLLNTEVALTNRRLLFKTGFIQRRTADLVLNSIETVRIHQSVLGRLLNYGHVAVHGTGDEVWTTPNITDPVGFRRAIAGTRPAAAGQA
jgi:uncharacterized membrane protein YdbT with pleckstrin-like domain